MKLIDLARGALVLLLALAPLATHASLTYAGIEDTPHCASTCVTEYALPPASAGPFGITRGPDGAVWFSHGDNIGRITVGGHVAEYPVPTPGSNVGWLHLGPDRAIWFAERFGNKIGRITADGRV